MALRVYVRIFLKIPTGTPDIMMGSINVKDKIFTPKYN